MILNYLKSFIRNAKKGFGLIFINLLGYSFSISLLFLIGLYCHHELNYDTHFDGNERIFRVELNRSYPSGDTSRLGPVAPGVFDALTNDLKAVETATRIVKRSSSTVEVEGNSFVEENIILADSTFFDCFPIEILERSTDELLTVSNVVLTERMGKRYFGEQSPVGKFLTIDSKVKKVSAVVRDLPSNTHFDFGMIMLIRQEEFSSPLDLWMFPYSFYTYVTVPDHTEPSQVESELNSFVYEYAKKSYAQMGVSFDQWLEKGNGMSYILRPIKEIHMTEGIGKEFVPGGNTTLILTLVIIAIVVWILAWSNLASIIHARTLSRRLEFGIRKIFALSGSSFSVQFILEGFVLSLLTTSLSIVLLILLIPWYNETISVQLETEYILSNIWIFSIIHLVVGSLSGLYTSLKMVAKKPLDLIQNRLIASKSKRDHSNVLINSQFVISSGLLIVTLIMTSQLQFMINKDTGYDKDGLISISGVSKIKGASNLKSRLTSEPAISGVSFISQNLGEVTISGNLFDKAGPDAEMHGVNLMSIDRDFVGIVNLNLLQGRTFKFLNTNDTVNSIIVNESLVKLYGWEEPIGQVITPGGDWEGFKVIGVVEDFHFQPASEEISPLGILYSYPPKDIAVIKISDQMAVTQVLGVWSQFNNGIPPEIRYLESIANDLYQDEEKLVNSSRTFTTMAIILALIGLFGFASHMMQRKTKEIAIRKVSGASVSQLIQLFQKHFLLKVVISWVLSIPIAIFAIEKWLENFPYVHDVNYVQTTLLTMVILVAVSILAVLRTVYMASTKNPVEVLRQ
ncbi:MAG: ABC transporter permease [Cyclobacteriaceae bacterium]